MSCCLIAYQGCQYHHIMPVYTKSYMCIMELNEVSSLNNSCSYCKFFIAIALFMMTMSRSRSWLSYKNSLIWYSHFLYFGIRQFWRSYYNLQCKKCLIGWMEYYKTLNIHIYLVCEIELVSLWSLIYVRSSKCLRSGVAITISDSNYSATRGKIYPSKRTETWIDKLVPWLQRKGKLIDAYLISFHLSLIHI